MKISDIPEVEVKYIIWIHRNSYVLYRDIQSDFDYKKVVQVLLVSYEVKVRYRYSRSTAMRNASMIFLSLNRNFEVS